MKKYLFLIFVLLFFIFGCNLKGSKFIGNWHTNNDNLDCKIKITKDGATFFVEPIGKFDNCRVVGFYTLTKEGNLSELGPLKGNPQFGVSPTIITFDKKNKQIKTGYISWVKLKE